MLVNNNLNYLYRYITLKQKNFFITIVIIKIENKFMKWTFINKFRNEFNIIKIMKHMKWTKDVIIK